MSSDDGIYILVTPKGQSKEFRVAHLMAIENLDFTGYVEGTQLVPIEGDICPCCGQVDLAGIQIQNARRMWAKSEVFTDRGKALEVAHDMYDSSVEYGVSEISINREF